MLYFIYFLNFFFNFFYGVFIPIVTEMNSVYAGIAFSAYGFTKLLSYKVFGELIDRNKLRLSLYITLFLLTLVPVFYLILPENPIMAKTFEGVAFAGGTVFCFAFLTIVSSNKQEFEKELKTILILSSLGSLFGPVVGYAFLDYDLGVASGAFLFLALVINGVGYFYHQNLGELNKRKCQISFDDTRSDKLDWNLVFIILILKGILMGVQPCISYWTKDIFHFNPLLSGVAYLVSGLGFILGTLKPKYIHSLIPIISVILIELSFHCYSWLFWPGNFLLSFWIGRSIVKSILELGWVTTDKTGKLNSTWLTISDIPLMLTPMIFWELKELDDIFARLIVLLTLIIMFIFFEYRYKNKLS